MTPWEFSEYDQWKTKYLANETCKVFQFFIFVLFIRYTETKYIKLKTKTKNNIVIFGMFHKKLYCYFGFFLKQFD